jgi:glycosyltransferase involved in cell wall biosynthesis
MMQPGAFLPAGGLEMYGRSVIMALGRWCRERGGRAEVMVLNDRTVQLDPRYLEQSPLRVRAFGGRRPAFVASCLSGALSLQPTLLINGHVNFSALALATGAAAPRAHRWLLTYGIDVWHALPGLTRLAIRRTDTVVSISQFTLDELQLQNGTTGRATRLLPCALDPFYAQAAETAATSSPGAGQPRMLTVARLARSEGYKGIDSAIRAFAKVSAALPEARYDIIGQGDDRPRLEAVARECGVADRVVFHGRVSTEALAQAYRDCRFFVMPSAKEGFGIVFLEAAVFGRPSIAGNHGGSPEVVADEREGYLVTHGDVDQLADRMRRLLADPALAGRLGQNARERLHRDFVYPAFERRAFALLDEAHAG